MDSRFNVMNADFLHDPYPGKERASGLFLGSAPFPETKSTSLFFEKQSRRAPVLAVRRHSCSNSRMTGSGPQSGHRMWRGSGLLPVSKGRPMRADILSRRGFLTLLVFVSSSTASAQEQIDKLDPKKAGAAGIGRLAMRVRVTRCEPASKELVVEWRRGGEGLGGSVVRGRFTPEAVKEPDIDAGLSPPASSNVAFDRWTAWIPLETVVGKAKGWEFPSVTVNVPKTGAKPSDPPRAVTVAFEFAESGRIFRRFTEEAPKGATVGFAFPGGLSDERGAKNEAFAAALDGLSGHARARRERLEAAFPEPFAPPQRFGLIGHLGGYGEGPGAGKGKAIGFGVRHCNPAIVAEECRTLQLLGINGLVGDDSLRLADAAGSGKGFRRIFWGGPGSGSPMAAVSSSGAGEPDGCPFDSRLPALMAERARQAIHEHQASGADERWGLWWDEIGVAVKGHMNDCETCRAAFCDYLRQNHVNPEEVGSKSWDDVRPFRLFEVKKTGTKTVQTATPAPPESDASACRLYYHTYRFMTHATAQLFPASAAAMKAENVRLYAMQGPTPSWAGHSLDWHEFYDEKANTAVVWETSNRDPRVWQWESYLGDVVRGIAARHDLPIGCLVKPHRGAPQQRMLSVVTRGAKALEWYTYGPDYSKGDSFSQSPELLEEVAEAGRFLARAEPFLYEAEWAQPPEVAFVSPRSSEIWGKAGDLNVTAFEDAKWVYLALRHAHIPVDVLSEKQVAEGAKSLDRYKVLYVVGPNLHRDAAAEVSRWVKAGGVLWTDALGLSRDEAQQPLTVMNDLFGVSERRYESWGTVPAYRATALEPLVEKNAPESAQITLGTKSVSGTTAATADFAAAVGREPLARPEESSIEGKGKARFADGVPALVECEVGKGKVVHAGFWAGLTYSARVRRPDFDMPTDFPTRLRELIAGPALQRGIVRAAIPADPLVECVALQKDGRTVFALMNWAYRRNEKERVRHPIEHANLRIDLPGLPASARLRSLQQGDLKLQEENGTRFVVLPKLAAIDLLIAEPPAEDLGRKKPNDR